MNVHGELHPQLVGQVFNEFLDFPNVLSEFDILYYFFGLDISVKRQVIVIIDFVKDSNFLL